MGDPKRKDNLWKRPKSIWQKARMTEETALMKEFGLRRKSELWRTNGLVSKYSRRAKSLITSIGEQAEKEKALLIQQIQSLGILGAGAALDDVLAIKPRDFLERRLQTVVYRKGFAKTMKQARQFIVHKHVKVDDNVVISPSFLVTKVDESRIVFRDNSALADEEHPERTDKQNVVEPEEKVEKTESTEKSKEVETKEEVKEESKEEKVDEKTDEKPAKEEPKAEEKEESTEAKE